MEHEPGILRISILSNVRAGRDALAQALAAYPNITVLGAHPPDGEGLAAIAGARPDAVLLDGPTAGVELLLSRLRAAAAGAKVIVLGVVEDEAEVLACAASGVSGYIPRDASLDMLVRMIEAVVRGELVCSPRMAAAMFKRIASLGAAPAAQNGSPGPSLTPREAEIAALLEHGLSNKEIARSLGIRVATVKNHVHHILGRLQVRRRGEAAQAHRQRNELAAD